MRANSRSLIVLSATHGTNHFYQLLLPVAVWQIAEEFNLSHFLIGSLIFAYTISYALLQIPFGYLASLQIYA
jgi:MFS family permease